jgi:hypothetical protein
MTNGIGSSGVDPGQLLVSIEICPSPIRVPLEMEVKIWAFHSYLISSIFEIHHFMDLAV